jgi:hypothetical protein
MEFNFEMESLGRKKEGQRDREKKSTKEERRERTSPSSNFIL